MTKNQHKSNKARRLRRRLRRLRINEVRKAAASQAMCLVRCVAIVENLNKNKLDDIQTYVLPEGFDPKVSRPPDPPNYLYYQELDVFHTWLREQSLGVLCIVHPYMADDILFDKEKEVKQRGKH